MIIATGYTTTNELRITTTGETYTVPGHKITAHTYLVGDGCITACGRITGMDSEAGHALAYELSRDAAPGDIAEMAARLGDTW